MGATQEIWAMRIMAFVIGALFALNILQCTDPGNARAIQIAAQQCYAQGLRAVLIRGEIECR
jgi:hypothetical protein